MHHVIHDKFCISNVRVALHNDLTKEVGFSKQFVRMYVALKIEQMGDGLFDRTVPAFPGI